MQALIDNLVERGLNPAAPRPFIIDGSKALSKAIRATFGREAAIQRCQIRQGAQHHGSFAEIDARARGLRHFPRRWIYCSGSIRARNSSMPARPNMARLSVFNLLIWPSAWPLLHGSAIAFLTASMSRANIRANCCRA